MRQKLGALSGKMIDKLNPIHDIRCKSFRIVDRKRGVCDCAVGYLEKLDQQYKTKEFIEDLAKASCYEEDGEFPDDGESGIAPCLSCRARDILKLSQEVSNVIPPLTEDEKRRLRGQESRIELIRDYKNRTEISLAVAFRVVEEYRNGFDEGLKYGLKKI